MKIISTKISELTCMKKYPDRVYYQGSLELLERPKVSIVGTRHPNPYTRSLTFDLAKRLSLAGMVIVSGAAGGVDTLAHLGAGMENTIAVLPGGIDIRYPASNKKMIEEIENKGLTMSLFEPAFVPQSWSFVVRNELVVALGDVLIVTEADMGSGSMRSVEYALEMGKPIYVLPHRLHESEATHKLLAEGKAEAIEDMEKFVQKIAHHAACTQDTPFIAFCRKTPTYDEAVSAYPSEIFEAELSGKIEVRNGRVSVV